MHWRAQEAGLDVSSMIVLDARVHACLQQGDERGADGCACGRRRVIDQARDQGDEEDGRPLLQQRVRELGQDRLRIRTKLMKQLPFDVYHRLKQQQFDM